MMVLPKIISMSQDDLLVRVGRRIERLREEAGLTQSELAQRVPCAQSLVSRIEKGRVAPSLATLQRIARALGVGLADLVGNHGDAPDLRRLLRDPDATVVYGGRVLSEGERERIVELIDAALALRDEADEARAGPSRTEPMGPIAASMAERDAYGRHDPALNAFLQRVIQQALEEYDRKHGHPPAGRGPSSGG